MTSSPTTGPEVPAPIRYRVGGPGIAWRETGGEIVILDIEGSTYFALNGSAAGLWKRLAADGADPGELTDQLSSAAPVDRARAGADVDRFLSDLAGLGLLHTD